MKIRTSYKRVVALFLAVIVLHSCAIRSLVVISKAELVSPVSKEISIPFEETYGLLIVPIQIEGKTYRFVFDTGAQTTVISTELAKLESFKEKGGIPVSDAHQSTSKLPVGAMKEMILGEIHYKKVGAIVNDFSANDQFKCIRIDGILGMNAIQLNNWKVDYEKKTLTCYNLKYQPTSDENSQVFPFVSKTGIPYINLFVDGQKEKFMVDTGKNSDIISVSSAVSFSKKSNESIGLSSFGMFGKTELDTTRYYQVNLSDSLGFNMSTVSISQQKNFKSIIGNGFYNKNYSSVFFDFKNRKMYCSGIKHIANIYSSFGFNPMISGDYMVVASKELNFSKDMDWLAVQDTILSVNGIALTSENLCDATTFIQKSRKENAPLTVEISHNNFVRVIHLKLREVTVD